MTYLSPRKSSSVLSELDPESGGSSASLVPSSPKLVDDDDKVGKRRRQVNQGRWFYLVVGVLGCARDQSETCLFDGFLLCAS